MIKESRPCSLQHSLALHQLLIIHEHDWNLFRCRFAEKVSLQSSLGIFAMFEALISILIKSPVSIWVSLVLNVVVQMGSWSKLQADSECSLWFHLLPVFPIAVQRVEILMNCTLCLQALRLGSYMHQHLAKNWKSFKISARTAFQATFKHVLSTQATREWENVVKRDWNVENKASAKPQVYTFGDRNGGKSQPTSSPKPHLISHVCLHVFYGGLE